MGLLLGNYFGKIYTFNSTALFRASINMPASAYGFLGKLDIPYPLPSIILYALVTLINTFMWKQILEYRKYKIRFIIFNLPLPTKIN